MTKATSTVRIATTAMTTITNLARLLQLASPTLPVGAYSYSQGLEAAIEAGIVKDAPSAERWISDVLELSFARMEAPMLLRFLKSNELEKQNAIFLATRETAELRAETVQMGYSLNQLLPSLGVEPLTFDEPSFPAAFAAAAGAWKIDPRDALQAYMWAWIENQVMAAVKTVPLGQTDGQKMLFSLGQRIAALARESAELKDEQLGNFMPGLAVLSSKHETQYSRLFRS